MTYAWAYEFDSALPLVELQAKLNAIGTWLWTARENDWYGEYLICRPADGVRVRIHDRSQPFFGSMEREAGPQYKCQLDVNSGEQAVRQTLDPIFKAMVEGRGANRLSRNRGL